MEKTIEHTARRVCVLALVVASAAGPEAVAAQAKSKSAHASKAAAQRTPAKAPASKSFESAQCQSALQDAAKAKDLVRERKFVQAQALYASALARLGKQNPLAAAVYSLRGISYLVEGKNSAALNDFNSALTVLPTSDAELKEMARARNLHDLLLICIRGKYFSEYLLGQYEAAAECNLKLCLLDPQDAGACHLDAAVLYVLANKGDKALRELDSAVLADPQLQSEAEKVKETSDTCADFSDEQRKVFLAWFDKRLHEFMEPVLSEYLSPQKTSAAAPVSGGSKIVAVAPSAEGPVSIFCDRWEHQLKTNWKPIPGLDDSIILNFQVDRQGNVSEIEVDKDSQELSETIKKSAVEYLVLIGKVDGAPADAQYPFRMAARLSNNPDKIYASWRDLDLKPYMAGLQHKIRAAWHPPKRDESAHVKIVFKVARDGSISKLQLSKPTGIPEVDKAALAAGPHGRVEPLPDGAPESVDVEFSFDFNVMPTGSGGKPAGGALRDRVVTEDNQAEIWEQLKNSPDVTLEQYNVLLLNADHTGTSRLPKLPVGKTVGALLDEQMSADKASRDQFNREQIMMEDAAEAKDPLRKLVKVEVVSASYSQDKVGVGEEEPHCALTLTLRCTNPSTTDVKKYHGVIDFKRGADYLSDVTIVREEGLKAGETRTITETFRDDEPNRGWKAVSDSNLSGLRIRWRPWKITLSDGTLLTGTME